MKSQICLSDVESNSYEKVCKRCGMLKPITEYYIHKMMADGHLNFCKECTKKRVTKHWYSDVERHRESENDRYKRRKNNPAFLMQRYEYHNRWRTPEKDKAHNAVNRNLDRSPWCQLCGNMTDTEGHHEDYSKPLEVVWLCSPCHKKVTLKRSNLKDVKFYLPF